MSIVARGLGVLRERAQRAAVPPSEIPRWLRPSTAAVFALVLAKLLLVTALPMRAVPEASFDDELFIRLARSLATGGWLGPYNEMTLAKGPGYPLFIAICRLIGLPLLLGQHLFYIGFCFALLAAVRPFMSRAMALIIFAIVLFNPASFGGGELSRVLREPVYAALTGYVVACAIGLLLWRRGSLTRLFAWSGGLGLSLAWFWLTREEGVWIVPALVLILGCATAAIALARDQQFVLRLAGCALPLVIWGAALLTVATINQRYYGVFATSELKAKPFVDAYGAMMRVKPVEFHAGVFAPAEARQKMYAVSPALAEMKSALEEACPRWSSVPREYGRDYGKEPGGWFIWTFRQAAALSGRIPTGPEAMKYYERVASEINAACDRGELPALAHRSTLSPPLDWRYFPGVRGAMAGAIVTTARFGDVTIDTKPSGSGDGGLAMFREMTGGAIAPSATPRLRLKGWAFAKNVDIDLRVIGPDGRLLDSTLTWHDNPHVYYHFYNLGQDFPRARHAAFELSYPDIKEPRLVIHAGGNVLATVGLDGKRNTLEHNELHVSLEPEPAERQLSDQAMFRSSRRGMLGVILWVYRIMTPIAAIVALIAVGVQIAAVVVRRATMWSVVSAALLMAVITRWALLALIDATSFPAILPTYLAPVFPLLLMLCVLSIWDATNIVRRWKSAAELGPLGFEPRTKGL